MAGNLTSHGVPAQSGKYSSVTHPLSLSGHHDGGASAAHSTRTGVGLTHAITRDPHRFVRIAIYAILTIGGAAVGWMLRWQSGAAAGLLVGLIAAWAVSLMLPASALDPSALVERRTSPRDNLPIDGAVPKTSTRTDSSATKSAIFDGGTKSGFYPVTKTSRPTRGGDL